MAQGVAKRYMIRKTKGGGDNLKNKMHFLLSNKNICLKRKSLTKTRQDSYVETLHGSIHLIYQANEVVLLEKINLTFFQTSKQFIWFGFYLKRFILKGQKCEACKNFLFCARHS
jgi:hypothetical protein